MPDFPPVTLERDAIMAAVREELGRARPNQPQVSRTPMGLLRALRDMGTWVRLDGERLYVDITDVTLPRVHLEAMYAQREELLTLVEWFEERAALLEYSGGLSREQAEREAWRCLEKHFCAMQEA